MLTRHWHRCSERALCSSNHFHLPAI